MPYASPEAKIEHALLARLEILALEPAIAVAWPGITFPAAGQNKPERYLRVEHDAISKSRPFLSGTFRQRGSLFVSACLKLDTPTSTATDIAGSIASHFPPDHEETVDGVTVRILERPEVQGGYRDDIEQRWRVPVIIQYEAWVQAS